MMLSKGVASRLPGPRKDLTVICWDPARQRDLRRLATAAYHAAETPSEAKMASILLTLFAPDVERAAHGIDQSPSDGIQDISAPSWNGAEEIVAHHPAEAGVMPERVFTQAVLTQAIENLRGRTFRKGRRWELPDEGAVKAIAAACEAEIGPHESMDRAHEVLDEALRPYKIVRPEPNP